MTDNGLLRCTSVVGAEGVPTEVPDPSAVPHLASISPDQGAQGASLEVVITGANTDFNGPNDDLPSTVDFGDGIAVNSTTVSSDTLITVQIAIAGDAAVGWRPVSVTCADGSVMTIFFEVL